jgi:hypothetical protein
MSSNLRNDKTGSSSIHLLDFLYPPGETSENLISSITNEFIRHFGNSVYVNDSFQNAASLQATGKQQSGDNKHPKEAEKNKNTNGLTTAHKLLDVSEFRENVVDIAVNKKFLCVLFDDGSVHRATCISSKDVKDNSSVNQGVKTEFQSSGSQGRTEPFQVASDESFARALERRINPLTDNILSERRTYNVGDQSPPPPNIVISNVSAYSTPPIYSPFSHPGLTVPMQPMNQRIPTRSYSRYMPYSSRQRRIHMSQLLNLGPSSSIIYPQNSEELTQETLQELPDEPQMDLLNNITIVSLDNEPSSEFQISGLQSNPMSGQTDLTFPLPNTGIINAAIDNGDLPLENRGSPIQQQQISSQEPYHQSTTLHQLPPVKTFESFESKKAMEKTETKNSEIAGGASFSSNSPKKSSNKQEASLSHSMFTEPTQNSSSSMFKKDSSPSWSSELGNLQESGLMVSVYIF